MNNVNYVSGKGDGMSSKYVKESYIGFKLFIGGLVAGIIFLVQYFI